MARRENTPRVCLKSPLFPSSDSWGEDGGSDSGLSVRLGARLSGRLDAGLSGLLDLGLSGLLDARLSGRLDAWMSG